MPAEAIHLTCDRMAVAQLANRGTDDVELEAVGNAIVQGEGFTATGGRISYARSKDQLILEGDGRNDARIEFPEKRADRPSYMAAGKILYRPKTRELQVIDLRQTEIYDVGQSPGRAAPAIRSR
jgi:hypothetical protein